MEAHTQTGLAVLLFDYPEWVHFQGKQLCYFILCLHSQTVSSYRSKFFPLTLLHSEQPKLHSFGHSECNRVKSRPLLKGFFLSGSQTRSQECCSPLTQRHTHILKLRNLIGFLPASANLRSSSADGSIPLKYLYRAVKHKCSYCSLLFVCIYKDLLICSTFMYFSTE